MSPRLLDSREFNRSGQQPTWRISCSLASRSFLHSLADCSHGLPQSATGCDPIRWLLLILLLLERGFQAAA